MSYILKMIDYCTLLLLSKWLSAGVQRVRKRITLLQRCRSVPRVCQYTLPVHQCQIDVWLGVKYERVT